jgi:cyclophilin family peptidyl-prolyl cis-trans isomerase
VPAATVFVASTLLPTADAAVEPTSSSSSSSSSSSTLKLPSMPDEQITDRVFFDVRVARKDGSTYIRDDLDDSFENSVLFCKLKIGLYGKACPNHVQQFLSYIEQSTTHVEELLDNPFPNYSRSTFPALDQSTGLLLGGNIASLRSKEVMGSTALTYGSRVLPANLWIDSTPKLSHNAPGLLTHRNLEVMPTFGITTRANTDLDNTHTVFGQILWDDEQLQFFRSLQDIPTYSIERPSGYDDFGTGEVASSLFNAQREFMRNAAKSLGDDRVSKLYDGKLLRRTEVLQVGRL